MDNSYILHETAHAVVIATGFQKPSSNSRTGALIQVWILNNRLTCADCKLCCGNASMARSIQIQPHGAHAKLVA